MGMRAQPPQDQFEIARKRAQQEANAAKQTQSDALKRRFAAQGMVNSGAAIKQERLANEAVDKQYAERAEGIDSAQQQEFARKQEVEDQRNFAREERVAGQQFASGERAASQAFASGERAASQAFAGNESAIARALQEKMFGQDMEFKQQARGDSLSQFDKQYDLSQKQFQQDREMTGFNAVLAAKEGGLNWTGFTGSDASFTDMAAKLNDQKAIDAAKKEKQAAALATMQTQRSKFWPGRR